jgi:hypothetical protein
LNFQKIENGRASVRLADNPGDTNGAKALCGFHGETMPGSGLKVKLKRWLKIKSVQKRKIFKINDGIPQMGDAAVARRGYLCVNLGDKETSSGCPLRPTRRPGKTPLIPISDHGNERLNFFCGGFS